MSSPVREVRLKRAYDQPSVSDGLRVLVERLWPRGIPKEKAHIDTWLRDVAPSDALRRWFHARPAQWAAFQKRYLEELHEPAASAALEELYRLAAKRRRLTLIYSSRNQEHNNAVVLQQLLEGMRKPPSTSGPAAAARGARRASRKR